MKKITQILFITCFCLAAFAQKPDGKNHFRVSNSADLKARLTQNLPEELQNLRTQGQKPKCIADSILYKNWNASTNSVVLSRKEEYLYNAQYNVFDRKQFGWQSFNQGWYLYSKTSLLYNNQNNLVTELYLTPQSQGTTTVWSNSSKNTYTYDSNNNITSLAFQTWDYQTNSWKTNSVNSSTYNTSNNLTQEIYQSILAPGGTLLVNNWKYTYDYDIFNSPLLFQSYEWNALTNTWDKYEKYTITASGNTITAYQAYEWDSATNSWINSFKATATYDGNGNSVSQIEQVWNSNTNTWVNSYKYTYTYDGNNNALSATNMSWDPSSNSWLNENLTVYTYNNHNYETTETNTDWNELTNSWVSPYESSTYYNCLSVGISEENEAKNTILLYPNPAQTELYVTSDKEFSDITIFNTNGQIVLKSAATTSLNVSSLEKGIYFVQVLDVNGSLLKSEKLIKD